MTNSKVVETPLLKRLNEQRIAAVHVCRSYLERTAKGEQTSAAEHAAYEHNSTEARRLTTLIEDEVRRLQEDQEYSEAWEYSGGGKERHQSASQERNWFYLGDAERRDAAVKKEQRFGDHEVVSRPREESTYEKAITDTYGSFGAWMRALSTSGTPATVPTLWASEVIDRARNNAAVVQAGATIIPMNAKKVEIARLTGDPTSVFRAEGSLISASDPGFDNVELDAKTASTLVVASMEWLQDSPNSGELLAEAMGKSIALLIDQQALFGGVVAGGETGATGFNTTFPTPPNPRGVLATLLAVAPTSVLGSGANGTAQTAASYYREVIQSIFLPRTFNEEPSALIWNAKLWQQYADAYATDNQPLNAPAEVSNLPRFVSNAIPSFTQGTMALRATDLFVADWRQLLIGQRLNFSVQFLTERYAEFGQVGVLLHWRGDVALARPRAFSVYRYLQGA